MDHIGIINNCNDIEKMNERLNNLSKDSYENETVMYIIINADLKMKDGKIAGQSCHSACRVTRIIENLDQYPKAYTDWISNFEPKIILKATQKELEELIKTYDINNVGVDQEIWCVSTRDIGRTQIERGSLTTIAFSPIYRKDTFDFIKKLKLA